MVYNQTYFNQGQIYDTKNGKHSFRHFTLKDGYKVGMFQGERGDKPELDFIIKFLPPGIKGRTRTPKHIHWVVDLLLKMEHYKQEVFDVICYYRNFYDIAEPFKNVPERDNYNPKTYIQVSGRHPELEHKGTYSLEYVCLLLELFTLCEKQSPRENKMFKSLLDTLIDYSKGLKDFYQVINASSPGY